MTSIESAKRYLVTLAPHIKSRKAAVLIGELILDLEDKIVENVKLKQENAELKQKLDNLNLITSDYRDYK
jgi:regulator of replication initiation timing